MASDRQVWSIGRRDPRINSGKFSELHADLSGRHVLSSSEIAAFRGGRQTIFFIYGVISSEGALLERNEQPGSYFKLLYKALCLNNWGRINLQENESLQMLQRRCRVLRPDNLRCIILLFCRCTWHAHDEK